MSVSTAISSISQFAINAFSAIKKLLEYSPQGTFEEFIKSRNPQTAEELEFATQQFNERRRLEVRLIQRGEYAAAHWLRKTY